MINDSMPPDGEVWHPYWELEELAHNMWGHVSRRQTWVRIAAEFTGDAELYGEWMARVLSDMPRSCEHNLTKPGDKRPWIGHAAVALAIGCPEDVVREAWGEFNKAQQEAANKKAADAIEKWRASRA